MNREELIDFLDEIEQVIRDVDGNESYMKDQLIDIADYIMLVLENE
jgi:hypothetical protein